MAALALGLAVLAGLALASGGQQVTSFNEVPGTAGMVPVASAAGPSASDDLIAGGLPSASTVVPAIFAVTAGTGKLDSGVGSAGRLPMPSGLPGGAQAKYLLFADNTIYASLYDGASGDAYVASWNAQGHLNSGFGSGGLVRIAPPASASFNPGGAHLADASELALAGGKLVLGEPLIGAGGGIRLYPLDPSTGSVGTAVTTPLPSGGFLYVDLDAMQAGPDGNLYLAGAAHGASGPSPLYFGVFNGSTLRATSQTTKVDGASASGDAVAFSGGRAYLGATSTTSSVNTTQVWSAPQGSATLTQGPIVPTQVSGKAQSFVALQTDSSGPLDAVVAAGAGSNGTTWVLQITGNTVGPGQRVGSSGDNAQTVSGDALLLSGNGYFTDGEHAFLAVFGTPVSTGCSPIKLDIAKTLVSDSGSYATVREVPPGSHHYEVADTPDYVFGSNVAPVLYVITVENTGRCTATDLEVADDLPSVFEFRKVDAFLGVVLREPSRYGFGGPLEISIASLPPGGHVQFTVSGALIHNTSSSNTADLFAPGFSAHSTIDVKVVPAPHATVKAVSPTSVQGAASGAPLIGVLLAIERTGRGGASDARVQCTWLANTRGKFKRHSCSKPIWLKASGTKHWRLRFKRLPRGRYFLLVEALGKHGLSADTFSKGTRDSGILRVR